MDLPKNEAPDFSPIPAGTHLARCVRFIDMGSHEQTYLGESKGKKRLVLLTFETPDELMDDGRPFTISKRYTWSMHEKARLRQDIEAWRGARFKDAELDAGVSVKEFLGKPAMITVTHDERDDRTYANINSISPPMKGVEVKPQINETVYVALTRDEFDKAQFDTLSDNLRSKIGESSEYQALFSKPASYAAETGRDDPARDTRYEGRFDERNPPPIEDSEAHMAGM